MPLIISRMCLLVLPTIDGNVSLPFPLVTRTRRSGDARNLEISVVNSDYYAICLST